MDVKFNKNVSTPLKKGQYPFCTVFKPKHVEN